MSGTETDRRSLLGKGWAFGGLSGENRPVRRGQPPGAGRGGRPGKVTLPWEALCRADGGLGARLVAGAQQALTWDRPAWKEETSWVGES